MSKAKSIIIPKDNINFKSNFIDYNRSKEEFEKMNALSEKLFRFYSKVYNPKATMLDYNFFDINFCSYSYLDAIGYCTVRYYDHEKFKVTKYGDDLEYAFTEIVGTILHYRAADEEIQNRKKIRKEYKKIFPSTAYFSDYYIVKYILDKFNIYYDGNIPMEIIIKYMCYLEQSYSSFIFNLNNFNKKVAPLIDVKKKVLNK